MMKILFKYVTHVLHLFKYEAWFAAWEVFSCFLSTVKVTYMSFILNTKLQNMRYLDIVQE
jgi:hypothetical protein